MMTSLAFPDRRVFKVLLYPKVTVEDGMSVEAFELCDVELMTVRSNEPFPLFMTSAKRELIDSAVFFDFFVVGAISFLLLRVDCTPVFSVSKDRGISLRDNSICGT